MAIFRLLRSVSIAVLCCHTALAQANLDTIKSNGHLRCGVSQGLPGFSNPNDKNDWSGIDVDVCRAVAAAVFNDPNKVKYIPLSAKERFTALQSGEVDILSRNTTWTFTRDTSLGLDFTAVTYYDGQGFMIRRASGIKDATTELDGATVCTSAGTTTELNIADFFRAHEMQYKILSFEKADEVIRAYDSGRCDVFSTDISGLAAQRVKLKNPKDHVILDTVISKEPLGPVVRQGDDRWANVVRWTVYAMINAEELGVNSKNVDEQLKTSSNPAIKRLLGKEGALGGHLDLSDKWAYQIIAKVGNYGEIFARNLGPETPINLPRGLNRLWNDHGLQYAPPLR